LSNFFYTLLSIFVLEQFDWTRKGTCTRTSSLFPCAAFELSDWSHHCAV